MSLTAQRPPDRARAGVRRPRRGRQVAAVVGLLGAVVALRTYVVAPLEVASHSMEPTLRVGDVVLATRFVPGELERGDLVVFDEPGTGRSALKRVVGLPGERIVVRDSVLHVDDRPQREPFVDHTRIDGYYSRTYVVPADHLLLLGDNRGNSVDSRDYGPVPMDAVRGVAVVGLWPPGGFEERGRPPKP